MKTKTIPFDLEMAKKIQEREIEGKIKTKGGCNARIIYWDKKGEYPIIALVGIYEELFMLTAEGNFLLDGESLNDLVLEVPDNESQFNSSYSIEQLDKLKEYTKQLMEVNQGVIDDLSSIIQETEKICNLSLKTKFKPFDRVLVRNKDTEGWHPSLYATTDGLLYYTIDCKNWQQCIPYEGNEDLVGITNKPKEK